MKAGRRADEVRLREHLLSTAHKITLGNLTKILTVNISQFEHTKFDSWSLNLQH